MITSMLNPLHPVSDPLRAECSNLLKKLELQLHYFLAQQASPTVNKWRWQPNNLGKNLTNFAK